MSRFRTSAPVMALAGCAALCLAPPAIARPVGGFFAPPEGPFITAPDEQTHAVSVGACNAHEAQAALDAARQQHPEAFIILRPGGIVTVSDAPLRIGSRMAVVFSEGAGVVADANATADALISITDADTVALSAPGLDRALLDGNNRPLTGIRVRGSARVHIDHLLIRDCGVDGISYAGRGDDTRPVASDWWRRKYDPEVTNQAGSITRCRIQGSGGNGALIRDVAQFMFVDNILVDNAAAGVDIRSFNSVVGGGIFSGNAAGIVQRSTDAVVVSSTLRGNGVGVSLAEGSDLNLVTYNHLAGNETGIEVDGTRNSVYHNDMENPVQFQVAGTGNLIASHRGVGPAEAEGNVYFNPPTFTNNHQDPVIVGGMGRRDIEVRGGKGRAFTPFTPEAAVDLGVAQEALDNAREAHPDDVIVAHLRGRFIATGEGSGLRIPANVCVILYGAILAHSDELEEVVMMEAGGFASFSGGTVDANFQVPQGIHAPGKNIAVIDGVTVKNAGFNAINTKEHGGPGSPIFIRGCTVINSRNRGIWIHVTADAHVIDNVSSGNRSDGIDLDAYCFHSTALLNVCTANMRSGVFIEEGINSTITFGNVFNRNNTGILVYNHSVQGNTGANVMACNQVRENTHFGVSIRGMRSPNITSHGNFVFGNVIEGNLAAGVRFGHPDARDNYVTQNVLRWNEVEIDYIMDGPVEGFFSAPGTGME